MDYKCRKCDTCEAKMFKWVTPIGNESGGHFERLPGTVRPRISMTSGVYYPGREFSMKAAEMHEVACKDDQWTCWLIDEGDMDPNYQPIVWSLVDDLDQWKPTGLYEKFTGVPEIRKLMKDAGIQHFDLGER